MLKAEDIMWADEISRILGVKVSTLYNNKWKARSRFPIKKRGRKLFSIRSDVERWYRGNTAA